VPDAIPPLTLVQRPALTNIPPGPFRWCDHAERRYSFEFVALPSYPEQVRMSALRRLWQGDLPLPQAFWNWAVAGGIAVNALTSILFLALIMADRVVAAFVAGYALSVPYNIVVVVGVWRSAGRYQGERRWADLARIVTVSGMVLFSVT
jgi:hypothetical protein